MVASDPIRGIIRLTPAPVPMKSAEMTQQQKIAAALARAGTSHSTAWVHESTGVAVEAAEPDFFERTTSALEVHSARLTSKPKPADITHRLIGWGLALAVLSRYLLVTFR